MGIILTTHRNRPALEIEDSKSEVWLYHYAVLETPAGVWTCRLTAVDPETGEPACDRQGRERSYPVTFSSRGEWCACPDFVCRKRAAGERCKHLAHGAELRQVLAAMTGVSQ